MFSDAIASDDNIRITPSLRSKKGKDFYCVAQRVTFTPCANLLQGQTKNYVCFLFHHEKH